MIRQSIFLTSSLFLRVYTQRSLLGSLGSCSRNPFNPSPNTDAVGVTGIPGPKLLRKLGLRAWSIPTTDGSRVEEDLEGGGGSCCPFAVVTEIHLSRITWRQPYLARVLRRRRRAMMNNSVRRHEGWRRRNTATVRGMTVWWWWNVKRGIAGIEVVSSL